jgi:hypothetical protein
MPRAGKKRNTDGSFRNIHRPKEFTARSVIARWIEAETYRLKIAGMTFSEIANHVIGVAQKRDPPLVPLTPGLEFPENYRITPQGIHQAFERSMRRAPILNAEASRQLDTERCDAWLLALTERIERGEPKAIATGIMVLRHRAQLNGYLPPVRFSDRPVDRVLDVTASSELRDPPTPAEETQRAITILEVLMASKIHIMAENGTATLVPARILP